MQTNFLSFTIKHGYRNSSLKEVSKNFLSTTKKIASFFIYHNNILFYRSYTENNVVRNYNQHQFFIITMDYSIALTANVL